ncbi:resact receptor-like isoform X2 [Clytia hemisphaerica]|uniref:resact receptor-like isoform X2 n=1 Tax=Clytia hemisphaerica TaxID=252671 RepID=UPI0034D3DDDA
MKSYSSTTQCCFLNKNMVLVYLVLIFLLVSRKPVFGFRGDDYKIDKENKGFYDMTCSYTELNGVTGKCFCPKYNHEFDSFGCKCKHQDNNVYTAEEQYICDCGKKETSPSGNLSCQCVNLRNTLHNLTCASWSGSSLRKDKGTILLGVLLPYSLGKAQMTAYYSGSFYASAMFIAIDDVNNNTDLLPNHKLELIWADTKCDWKETIQLQLNMMKDLQVDAFIGGGCEGCEATARNAGAENLPFISHMCQEQSLSNKVDYPTFARTEPIGRQLTPAIKELLKHFKWNKFALIGENSTMYEKAFDNIKLAFGKQVLAEAYMPPPAKYSYDEHYRQAREDMLKLKDKARIIILLMSIRVVKECLIAAADLDMIGGDYVFLAFEIDIAGGTARQSMTFKWATADYAAENQETFQAFIERSKKLCKAWEATLLMMTKLPEKRLITSHESLPEFQQRVRDGMKNMFNSSVYEGFIPATNYSRNMSKPPTYAQNLYDAIMFYAITVNDTISQGGNYRNGTTIRMNMVNKVFASIHGYEMSFDIEGEVQYSFRLHHFGTEPSGPICNCLFDNPGETNKCIYPFPKMEPIGELELIRKRDTNASKNWEFQYIPIPDAKMYWPGGKTLENIRDEPECGFDGLKCSTDDDDQRDKIVLGVSIAMTMVGVILIIAPIVMYRQYKLEQELTSQLWKINSYDLTFRDWRSSQLSFGSFGGDKLQFIRYRSCYTSKIHVSRHL